jgi:glucose-1-phosphate adenylyltransferase
MPSMNDVLGIIMGGGRGSRLHPLTKMRSKPAVPIAGKYRLIDIPISNCINSGIYRVAILTQFNSVSLHRHITQTYNFDVFHTGWVDILAAEQTPERADWYQGTADAVRKQLFEIQASGAEYVLILAGDHLYRMDYREMANFLWEKGADIAVAVQPVARGEASRFGILKVESAQGPGSPEEFRQPPS